MELEGNTIPPHVRSIHMVAACGTGMGALACMLQDLGYEVTGSDQGVYPPMSDFLRQKGIRLFNGFSKENLAHNPDLVIIGNAVIRENPEALEVMKRKIPFCSMPQALNRFAARGKKIILVTGTHGKTSTSSLMAHLLHQAGLDPSFMIGGLLKNFNSNYRLGEGDYMVIEGDEYDTAFFDKGPKFMHYSPHVTIMTGVESDHADIFRDLDHVKETFEIFVRSLPETGLIVASNEDKNLTEILAYAPCPVESYGFQSGTWAGDNYRACGSKSLFEVTGKNGFRLDIDSPMMGRHNLMNTLAVVGAVKRLGLSPEEISQGIASFSGIKRRQEIRGIKNGITVMDDFAHHPTAVRETISAVKSFCGQGRLIAIFEPRTNSSMRNIFQGDYPLSFKNADLVCIRQPSRLDKIPSDCRLDSKKLVLDIAESGVISYYFEDTDSIIDYLKREAKTGDLLLIMSNGGFDNIHQRLLDVL